MDLGDSEVPVSRTVVPLCGPLCGIRPAFRCNRKVGFMTVPTLLYPETWKSRAFRPAFEAVEKKGLFSPCAGIH